LLSLLAVSVGIIYVTRLEEANLTALVRSAMVQPALDIEDAAAVLSRVRAIPDPPCSEGFLEKARLIVLQSAIIRDVAYQRNDRIVCSSMLGPLVADLPPFGPADFVASNGSRLWLEVPHLFAPTLAATLIEASHIVLMRLRVEYPVTLGSADRRLSVIRIGSGDELTTSSGPLLGLTVQQLRAGAIVRSAEGLVAPVCMPSRWLCFALSLEWSGLLHTYRSTLIAIAGLGGVLAGVFLERVFVRQRSLDHVLRRALRRRELELRYQPIVDANNGRVVSAEALLRWPKGKGEHGDPEVFVAVAEAGGYVAELTLLAIRTIRRDCGPMLRRHPDFAVSLNIAPSDLLDPRFIIALRDFVEAEDIRPHQLPLELTERSVVDTRQQVQAIQTLRGLGYSIYIDDFGTGYSSLAYLSDLAVDRIKIDQSFTQHVGQDTARARLVPLMLDMARELGIAVIVEGVETPQQRDYFLKRGVTLMQGWLFSRAVSPEELWALFEREAA